MPKNILGVVVDKVWESCGMVGEAVGKIKVWVKLGNTMHMEKEGYTQVIRRGVDENTPL